MSHLQNLTAFDYFTIILICVVAAAAVAAVRRIMPRLVRRAPGRWRYHLLPLTSLLRMTIYLVAFWQVLSLLIEPTQERVVALLGASALALGFAMKDYASSLIAGLVALTERTYRLGDRVKIGDTYGEVRALNLRSVKIVTPEDTAVFVPHSRLWDSPVYNANDGVGTMMCVAKFYLHAEHAGDFVRAKLIDVALTSPYTNLDRPIDVVAAEEPWGTRYKLKAYVLDNRDEFPFITDLTLRAKAAFARAGVKPAQVPAIGLQR